MRVILILAILGLLSGCQSRCHRCEVAPKPIYHCEHCNAGRIVTPEAGEVVPLGK